MNQITESFTSCSTWSSVYPSSDKISLVCSLRAGGGERMVNGDFDNLIGVPERKKESASEQINRKI
jgi:hypothetical protein